MSLQIIKLPQTRSMKRVNIFDPGMTGYGGHNADINLRVARCFEALGWRAAIYAHKNFSCRSSDIEIHAVFPINPYAAVGSYHLGLPHSAGSSVFATSVETVSEQVEFASQSDLTLFPTLYPCQATAIGQVQRGLGRIVGIIQFAPSWKNAFGESYWRQGLRSLQSLSNESLIGVLERELVLEYERLLESDHHKIHRFPVPYDGASKFGRPDRPFTVGILGHQRNEKRIDRLPYLVSTLRNAGFSVLLQDSSGHIKISNDDQHLKVLGYVENHADVIAECDVVVLDYDLDSYRFNGSGICSECIATGVPIIVPYGTSMSRLIAEYDAGLRFVSSDIESLLKQVQAMKSQQSEWTQKADRAKTVFKNENSTMLFVHAISH